MTVHALGCLSLAKDLCAAASTVSRAGDRGKRLLLMATAAAHVASEAGQKREEPTVALCVSAQDMRRRNEAGCHN